ncbi:MAG: hypothetical protein M0R75_01640 [Dehalococcoidia bacterium]|nr:hypothetical protein [Dehalococcoidia bacterium]
MSGERIPLLFAIDPGLDVVGGALFNPRLRDEMTLVGGARAFVRLLSFRTSSRDLVSDRCGAIAEWVARTIDAEGVGTVVLETPARDGGYQERVQRQRTKGSIAAGGEAKLNRALGALAAGAHMGGAKLVEVSSGTYPRSFRGKKARHDVMDRALRAVGKDPLKGNVDSRDAAFLGALYLCSHRGV